MKRLTLLFVLLSSQVFGQENKDWILPNEGDTIRCDISLATKQSLYYKVSGGSTTILSMSKVATYSKGGESDTSINIEIVKKANTVIVKNMQSTMKEVEGIFIANGYPPSERSESSVQTGFKKIKGLNQQSIHAYLVDQDLYLKGTIKGIAIYTGEVTMPTEYVLRQKSFFREIFDLAKQIKGDSVITKRL